MNNNDIHGIGSNMHPQNAVSVYAQDAMDDFPVLKAFQQYIDAEQAKARRRLLSLGIFFGVLTGAIIAVFVVMLVSMSARNQQLNDRLVEFAMKDRDRQSAVVVQPQDNATIMALNTKLNEMQRKLDESRAKAEKDAAVAAERARIEAEAAAAKPKGPTPEEIEIKRLTELLVAERAKSAEQARLEKIREERKKAAEEKERKRQEELEAYRRKHYPELYGLPKTLPREHRLAPASGTKARGAAASDTDEDDLLPDEDTAIDYFDDAEVAAPPAKKKAKATRQRNDARPTAPVVQPAAPVVQPAAPVVQPAAPVAQPVEKPYEIPVEVKGKNSSFRIPI